MHSFRRLASTSSATTALHQHPREFKQYIQLTDGALSCITTLSPSRPFMRLNIDSLSHPSWNPKLRDQLLMADHGEVAKFRKRFGTSEMDFSNAAEKFSGEVRKLASQTQSAPPRQKAKKK